MSPSPLPQRDGVDPVRVRLPFDGAWATVREYPVRRLTGVVPTPSTRCTRLG